MSNEMKSMTNTDYFQIKNVDNMEPFFMNVVSGSDLWTFMSSNGGITAGRRSADWALFPYDTDDKITASSENTGSKTLIRRADDTRCWEPFSVRSEGLFNLERNLYKSRIGNSVIYEELNHDWKLSFRWQWTPGDRFGFQREVTIENHGTEAVNLEVLDGIQNVMPCGVPRTLQQASSNLVNAYKQTQLEPQTGMGLFCLSAIIIDRAEPSEALRCNIVWQTGLEKPTHLLSAAQIPAFRKGKAIQEETLVKGECGAYLLGTSIALAAGEKKSWTIIADVMKDQTEVVALREQLLETSDMKALLDKDLEDATAHLVQLVAMADGIQTTADKARTARHFSNTMFNIMRGGIPLDKPTPENPLPLGFSRRHGDPTRPWNKFNINTTDPVTGKPVLDYEGNWRDIFQNWEALAISYPTLLEAMTDKFLSCTTADGYNPYRVTKAGFDWETEDPTDPWSYIGYWGDHQIIYLLRLMEAEEVHVPGQLSARLNKPAYPFANVPYRIKPYQEILRNPKDTIRFDASLSDRLKKEMAVKGVDAALLKGSDGTTVKASLLEKILVSLLAKLSNFIPNGGIWMNTQRPEWNDANNALVGGGLSVVTLCYLHRALVFYRNIVAASQTEEFTLSHEVSTWMKDTEAAFAIAAQHLTSNTQEVMDALGEASTAYRQKIYNQSFHEGTVKVQRKDVLAFLSAVLGPVEESIRANRRSDGLYHSYNIMELSDGRFAGIRTLSEMLEGQVAVLSSGVLTSAETLAVLDALRNSRLWREDQQSYMLYPNKDLPGFLEKNCLPKDALERSSLLKTMVQEGDKRLVSQDVCGVLHFNGIFRNAGDLETAMKAIGVAESEQKTLLDLFEETFDHKAFTGRSGTFYAYEGLGSIYWHMVSKLLVATQECYFEALDTDAPETEALAKHYHAILEGTGIHKSAREYGAFSTDAYSHTPWGKGARQPGMTGQVKEDILSRFGELGVRVCNGKVSFHPTLLKDDEFLPDGTLSFSYCGALVTYHKGGNGMILSEADSARLFARQMEKLDITV